MKRQTNELDSFDTMTAMKLKSERVMTEAFAVLDGLKENSITLPMATEMSNALGKANAAIGNIIKATVVELACEKQATVHQRNKLMQAM